MTSSGKYSRNKLPLSLDRGISRPRSSDTSTSPYTTLLRARILARADCKHDARTSTGTLTRLNTCSQRRVQQDGGVAHGEALIDETLHRHAQEEQELPDRCHNAWHSTTTPMSWFPRHQVPSCAQAGSPFLQSRPCLGIRTVAAVAATVEPVIWTEL